MIPALSVVGKSLAAVSNASLTVMNGDGGNASPHTLARFNCNGCNAAGNAPGIAKCGAAAVPGLATNLTAGGQQHLEGLNVSFTDGHVKWYKASSDQQSQAIYKPVTPFEGTGVVSGNNPTFRVQ